MFCSNCGWHLPNDALFCPKCGTRVMCDESPLRLEPTRLSRKARFAVIFICCFLVFLILLWLAFGRQILLFMSMKSGKIAEQCHQFDYDDFSDVKIDECTRNYATVSFTATISDQSFCRWMVNERMYYEYEPFKGWIFRGNDSVEWEELKEGAFFGQWELNYPSYYMYGEGKIFLEVDDIDFDSLTVEGTLKGNWDSPGVGPIDYEIDESGIFRIEQCGGKERRYYRLDAGGVYIEFSDKGIMFVSNHHTQGFERQ